MDFLQKVEPTEFGQVRRSVLMTHDLELLMMFGYLFFLAASHKECIPQKNTPNTIQLFYIFLVSIVEFETSPKKVDQKRKKVSSTNKKRQHLEAFPLDFSKESDSDTGEASPSASPDVEASEAASPQAVPQGPEVPPAPVEAAGGNVGKVAFFCRKGREDQTSDIPKKKVMIQKK